MSSNSLKNPVSSASQPHPSIGWLEEYYRSGSEVAFTKFVTHHGSWMYDRASRVVVDAQLAAEVVQDALAMLAKKRPHFPAELPLLAWLHRTVLLLGRNASAKERNYRKNLMVFRVQENVTLATAPETKLPESALRALEMALDRLPVEDREVLIARYFQKDSWESIASQCQCSADAIRKRGTRCLEKLAKCLREHGVVRPSVGVVATALQVPAKAGLPPAAELWAAAALKKSATISSAASLAHGWWLAQPMVLISAAAAIVALSGVAANFTSEASRSPEHIKSKPLSSLALATAANHPNNQLLHDQVMQLGVTDPASALAWAVRNLSTVRREEFLENLALQHIKSNPRRARPAISAMVPSGRKALLGLQYIREVAKESPEDALAFAEAELAGICLQEAKLWIAAVWLPQNPAQGMALLEEAKPWANNGNVCSVSWFPHLEGTFSKSYSATGSSGGDTNVLSKIQQALLNVPPVELFAAAEKCPGLLNDPSDLLKPALLAWCKTDTPAVLNWAQQRPELPLATASLYEYGIQTCHAKAWELLAKYPESSDWIVQHTPEEVLVNYADYAPHLTPHNTDYLLERVAKVNPELSLQILRSLPHVAHFTRERFLSLASKLPDGAFELLSSMPQGPAREEALCGFIMGARNLAPEVAAELYPAAEALSESGYRESCLRILEARMEIKNPAQQ